MALKLKSIRKNHKMFMLNDESVDLALSSAALISFPVAAEEAGVISVCS